MWIRRSVMVLTCGSRRAFLERPSGSIGTTSLEYLRFRSEISALPLAALLDEDRHRAMFFSEVVDNVAQSRILALLAKLIDQIVALAIQTPRLNHAERAVVAPTRCPGIDA